MIEQGARLLSFGFSLFKRGVGFEFRVFHVAKSFPKLFADGLASFSLADNPTVKGVLLANFRHGRYMSYSLTPQMGLYRGVLYG